MFLRIDKLQLELPMAEQLTGVEVTKMLNIPNISNNEIPEAKKHQDQGVHTMLYRFSPDDFKDVDKVWNGLHPEDGKPLVVSDGIPEGGPVNPGAPEPQVFAPGYHPSELFEIAQRMMKDLPPSQRKMTDRPQ